MGGGRSQNVKRKGEAPPTDGQRSPSRTGGDGEPPVGERKERRPATTRGSGWPPKNQSIGGGGHAPVDT